MAEFRQLIITNKGQALMAKMIAGSSNVKFTNVGTSSMVYTDEEIVKITNVDVKQTSLVSKVTRTNDVAVKIESAITNSELTTGYMMNTIVLYAEDPDEGEIVYAACGASSPGYMPPYNGVSPSGVYFKLITTVGNAYNVTLEIDPAAVATIGDVEDLQKQINDASDKIEVLDKNLYNPNLLINSNFALESLVNQRGQTEYRGNGYNIDMWKCSNVNAETGVKLTLENECIKLESTTVVDDIYTDFRQPIEVDYANTIAGKTVTATVDFEASEGCSFYFWADGMYSGALTGDGTRKTMTFTYTFGSSDSNYNNLFTVQLHRNINCNIGDYIKLYSIKVELGEVATPFVDDDPATKLAKCQRYLSCIPKFAYLRMSMYNSGAVYFNVGLPVDMRIKPRFVKPPIENTDFNVVTLANGGYSSFTLEITASENANVLFAGVKTSHGITECALKTHAKILLSAEL